MKQFYAPDEASANRCRRSAHKKPITVAGVDPITSKTNLYDGIIEAVEDRGPASQAGRRWRVTINEPD